MTDFTGTYPAFSPAANIQSEDFLMLTARSFNSTLDRMLTLNQAIDEALASSWNGDGSRGGRLWIPALDVIERQDTYLLAFEVPGVTREAIDISFKENVLTVRGVKPLSFDLDKDADVRVHMAERVSGEFERSVRLPDHVDSEHITAEVRDGVLLLTVPKAQAAQPRKIQIKGVEQKRVEG